MSRRQILTAIFCFFWHSVFCQPFCYAEFYDEDYGLPHSHLTQVLQDKHGFIWVSIWNGLCDKAVSDVAYACGFSDPKYFSCCFKASTGLTPKEYKTQIGPGQKNGNHGIFLAFDAKINLF